MQPRTESSSPAEQRVAHYHATFRVDTWDACSRCRGRCEIYKISTLAPGEKTYMARTLGLPLRELEERFLDRLDLGPAGQLDVIKLVDGCPWLDEQYRCGAGLAKPILCDSYPLVYLGHERRGPRFGLDRACACPMVGWPAYRPVIEQFEQQGIPALRRLRFPRRWWEAVALFDEFDYDYPGLERSLRTGPGYETYWLEAVLGFACGPTAPQARRRGLKLLAGRLDQAIRSLASRLARSAREGGTYARRLARVYLTRGEDTVQPTWHRLELAQQEESLLADPAGTGYRGLVGHLQQLLRDLDAEGRTAAERVRSLHRLPPRSPQLASLAARPLGPLGPVFGTVAPRAASELVPLEVRGGTTRDARAAYLLFARCFGADELDGPRAMYEALEADRRHSGSRWRSPRTGQLCWSRRLLVVARDRARRVVAAADGACLTDGVVTLFYLADIAVDPALRGQQIGSWLAGAILQAAEDHLEEAEAALGCSLPRAEGARLVHELCEVAFPDPALGREDSLRRLTYHGRLGRHVLWPLRHALDDTQPEPGPPTRATWNSIPLFLCHRSWSAEAATPTAALQAVELLHDWRVATRGAGPRLDQQWYETGLQLDGPPALIPLPCRLAEIPAFLERTGERSQLLRRDYPDHRYTRERLADR